MNKKENRLHSQKVQIESLIKKGYTKEVYKGLTIMTGEEYGKFFLKIFRDTASEVTVNYYYTKEEHRAKKIADQKQSYDIHEEWKAKRKAEQKGRLTGAAACADAIRAELKTKFPGFKFSVKSSTFSMGDSVDISWTDGPTVEEVEQITKKYQYGHFDGMEDIYRSSNRRDDIPQAKYVQTSRSFSEDVNKCREELAEKLGSDFDGHEVSRYFHQISYKTAFPLQFSNLRIEKTGVTCGSINEFYCIAFDVPKTEQKTESKPAAVEVSKDTLQVIEYGKGLAVIGNFSAYYSQLIAIGGKYNKFLSCGRGIVFSKSKLEEIKAVLTGQTVEEKQTEPVKPQSVYVQLPQVAQSRQIVTI